MPDKTARYTKPTMSKRRTSVNWYRDRKLLWVVLCRRTERNTKAAMSPRACTTQCAIGQCQSAIGRNPNKATKEPIAKNSLSFPAKCRKTPGKRHRSRPKYRHEKAKKGIAASVASTTGNVRQRYTNEVEYTVRKNRFMPPPPLGQMCHRQRASADPHTR